MNIGTKIIHEHSLFFPLYSFVFHVLTFFLSSLTQFRNGFHIVHICTEMVPVVSVGSLASYVTGLSHALQRQGNLVEVILPK